MKKKYEAPEFEIILLDLADVIRASGWAGEKEPEDEDTPFGLKWG